MDTFTILFVFAFGAIIGSFLNVVIFRINTGKNLGGRSSCLSCTKNLSFFELVPILSFFFQGGKCRKCKSFISFQYPIVEAITGIVFSIIFIKLWGLNSFPAILPLIFYFVIFSLLIVISVYDWKHMIIPTAPVYTFIILSFVFLIYTEQARLIQFPGVLNLFAGVILAIPFAALWFISRGKLMGFGDAKLALGIGALLGFSGGISAIILGVWAGAIYGFIYMALQSFFKKSKKLGLKSEVPLGPFLVFGTLLQFLCTFDLFRINDFLSLYL